MGDTAVIGHAKTSRSITLVKSLCCSLAVKFTFIAKSMKLRWQTTLGRLVKIEDYDTVPAE